MTKPVSGIGPVFRAAPSSFRTCNTPNIAHATDPSGEKTLCGRDASRWLQDDVMNNGPDCHRCMKVWIRLGGDDEGPAC